MEQNMDSNNHPTTDVCDTHLSLALGLTSTFNNNNNNNNDDNSMSEQEGYNNHGEEVMRLEKVSPARPSDEEEEEVSPRKKLRLTNHQSSLLEDTFKLHTTLTPCQKQALANQLNLRPRQVEVWFQNRRARTKLKQTEMECAMMKKRWEKLTEDNKRLQNELYQLKLISVVCPSCNKTINSKPPEPDHVHLYASPSVNNYTLVRELT